MNNPLYDYTKKCEDCALFDTEHCYLFTYVTGEHPACDEYIKRNKERKQKND